MSTDKSFTELLLELGQSLLKLVKWLWIMGLLIFIGVCGYKYVAQTQGEDVALGLFIILLYMSPFLIGGLLVGLAIRALWKYINKKD